jgi:hypothetical protein
LFISVPILLAKREKFEKTAHRLSEKDEKAVGETVRRVYRRGRGKDQIEKDTFQRLELQ